MPTPREKFQDLLKKLFQFDCADLDFGIYRIMNQKRAVIERFIEKDLMDGLAIEIGSGALKDEAAARREFDAVAAKIREELEESPGDAIDPEGNLIQYQTSRLGKQYLSLQERLCGARSAKELESDILNHLYTFFSRYYDEGDFMSLRRYSKRDKYAIPYNGEEVHLHWANADQYYIKTGENFTDYAYKHGGWTVQFKLRNASVEQNNVKGAKRFFVPRVADVVVDDAALVITIPFEYRPLNTDEEIRYGSKKKGENGNGESKPAEEAGGKKKKGQEGILADAVIAIQPAVKKNADALAALLHEKRKDADGNPVSLLDHYLRVYTRANSSDFFIHKDLKGFLERELDFYIKNEVLNLDDLEMGGETRAKSWFQMLRAIKGIGRKIITFVAQIENFQKRLFEKKKFVTEVHYCVTLDRVPEELYPEITKNKEQIEEWKKLFHVQEIVGDLATPGFKEPVKVDFLKENPNLVIDTRHFPTGFKDKLLGAPEFMGNATSIDGAIDGVLVEAENLHALRLLQNRFDQTIKCIYIDPPYNRGGDDFNYKDAYQHSSWLSMISDRLAAAYPLLRDNGVIFTSIDENERTNLDHALARTFGLSNRVEELIWAQNTTHSQSPTYSTNHEYIPVFAKNKPVAVADSAMFREPKPGFSEMQELIQRLNPEFPPIVEIEREIKALMSQHLEAYRQELHNIGLEYNEDTQKQDPWRGIYQYSNVEYRDAEGVLTDHASARCKQAAIWVWQEADASAPAGKQSETTKDPEHPNYRFYRPEHPASKQPCPHPKRGWAWPFKWDDEGRESFTSFDEQDRIVWGLNENKVPRFKRFLHEVETNVAKSVIHEYTDGEKQVANLFGAADVFPNPKPSTLIERFILQTCKKGDWVMDFFGGSGTTAQSVMDASLILKGRLKFVLVEMGKHYEHILLPRVKKLCYTPHWQDGKPKAPPTAEEVRNRARVIKCVHIESYEDALDNISFQPADDQKMLELDDYVLSYLLDFETKHSETLLNVAKLDSPFDYKLRRHGKDQPLSVDLPETFNYLIGLHVTSRTVHDNKGARYLVYRGKADGRETVILWRATRGWGKKEFEADLDFVTKHKLTEGAEDVFVNTDSFIEGARSLDPVFKRRMFNEE